MSEISVLIVEDSVGQRQFAQDMCIGLGFVKVDVAENGRAALEKVERSQTCFDIIICDLEMPDIDGIELLKLLSEQRCQSAFIIVSGREMGLISAVELLASKQGLWVLGSVKKPLLPSSFEKLLDRYYHNKGKCGLVLPQENKCDVKLQKLRQALAERKFSLHYQPQIDMQSGRLCGVEALVRLPLDGETVFPGDFIPLCEENGLIDELTLEILRLAVEQKKRFTELGLDIQISVNISAVSFDNERFTDEVMTLFNDMGADAKRITLEVTESSVIKDIAKALNVLARLRLIGCGLSIDDYGTGYSSVKQLSEIPFTELKLDRSLIEGVAIKPHIQAIFESTLSMCNKLGISLVAEGIEVGADWEYLEMNGCHIGQGFAMAPPMAADDLLTWIKNGMHPFNNELEGKVLIQA
ncbi:EAL domain-containing response regulator [Pseudoalteromonas piscicida]|uniref:Diguanylate cyclase n=1 Tax=Pseudoalteromonas piscicida TaxID=43662 RepID=A0A2A5JNZ2_PSEO7|nr:EAL domain-containing response regulator [Pseudoalteromonas piscicida]PCK31145.1 diguanylate cyclase [Pseudoalteromonas piscicida]